MLDRKKIMLETSLTELVVDSYYSSCDCNDKSYFLRVELAKHCFNNLVLDSGQNPISTSTYFSQNNKEETFLFIN